MFSVSSIDAIPEQQGASAVIGGKTYTYVNGSLSDVATGTSLPRPKLASATLAANGTALTADFGAAFTSLDYAAGFSVKVDGVSRAISAAVSGVSGQGIVFTLSSPAFDGQVVTLTYDAGPGNIETSAGLMLKSFSANVTNNSTVPVPVAPTLVSAVINASGTTLTATFTDNVVSPGLDATLGFTVSADASPVAISAATPSTNTIAFTIATVYSGQAVTLSYNATTGDIESDDGLALATFSASSVTNDSTQTPGPISCAYPLDASAPAVIAGGMTGRLTLSNADQTGSYVTQGGLASGQIHGMFSGASAALDLSGTNKAIEFGFVTPVMNGPGSSNPDVYAEVNLYAPGFASYLRLQLSCTDGTRQLNISKSAGGGIGSEIISADTNTIGVVFNAGTVSVLLNGSAVTLSDNAWATTSLIPVVTVGEQAGLDAADAGKTVSVTLRTDAANFVGAGYPAGATDPCGNAI